MFRQFLRLVQTSKYIGECSFAMTLPTISTRKLLQYNVPNGKKIRGLAVVQAFKALAQRNGEDLRLAQTLGWCIEMLQGCLLINDDIMDGSETRRGHKCWYKIEDVSYAAIYDAAMLTNCVYLLLRKYFADKEYYNVIRELFHEITFVSLLGQLEDFNITSLDLSQFTMERYMSMITNKTAYYSFYLPVALAMHMTGYKDPEAFHQAKTILFKIGTFYQVQNDFLDCFEDPAITGKIGSDIQERKCTWLAVVALQRCTNEQREVMKSCYGQKDLENVDRIKKLYEDLSIPHLYKIYEEELYKTINANIQQMTCGLPPKLFQQILEMFYQRKG